MELHRRFISSLIHRLIRRRVEPTVEEEEGASPLPSPWDSLLPGLVVDKIYAKLCLADRIRLRSVCKAWSSAVTKPPGDASFPPDIPWLILPESGDYLPSEIRLTSTADNRIYRFKLPTNNTRCSSRRDPKSDNRRSQWWCCCGSSEGWLLMAVGKYLLGGTDMLLWNPISGETKNLPPLSTLHLFSRTMVEFPDHSTPMSAMVRSMRVSPPSSEIPLIVAIILAKPFASVEEDPSEQIALCTPQDRAWKPVGGEKSYYFYQDLCFHKYNDNTITKLYALHGDDHDDQIVMNHDELSETSKYVLRLRGCDDDFDVILLRIRSHAPLTTHDVDFSRPDMAAGLRVWERYSLFRYLVQCSVTGEMLIVTAIRDMCAFRATTICCARGDGGSFSCTQISKFHVLRLDVTNYSTEDVKDGMGGQGVFVGQMGTVSLGDCITEDRIYFAVRDSEYFLLKEGEEEDEEEDDIVYEGRLFNVLEQGEYDLGRERVETRSRINVPCFSGVITGWFMPKL